MAGILDDKGQACDNENRTPDPHPCPFKSDINADTRTDINADTRTDINADTRTLCTCSPERQRECAAGI